MLKVNEEVVSLAPARLSFRENLSYKAPRVCIRRANAIRDNLIIGAGASAEKSAVRVEGQSKDEPGRDSGRSVPREESGQEQVRASSSR